MIDTSLPQLPFSHYFGNGKTLLPSVGILSPVAIKTIYEIKDENQQIWLGQVGEPIGCLRKDSNILLHRNLKAINTDTIREKIAADLFKYLGKDAFIFPEAFLSIQQLHPAAAVSNTLSNYYAFVRGIKKSLRVMYKIDYPWVEIKKVFTKSDAENHDRISLYKFIKRYHRLPSTVFYSFEEEGKPKKEIEVPLLGGIELIAAIKVLADTNGFKKSGKNVRIAWESVSNQVCAARLVKFNPGHSLRFIEEGYTLAQKLLNLIEKNEESEVNQMDSLKNIHLDEKDNLVIHWNALTADQKLTFQETIKRMISDLTKSEEGLYFCFHRNDSFDRGKTNNFPQPVARLLASQMKSWLELQEELYCKESNTMDLLAVSKQFSAPALKDFISSKPNLRQTFTSSDFVIRSILREISPSFSCFRVPEEGAVCIEPSGKRKTRVWLDEQENKWTGNIRKPIRGLEGNFCDPIIVSKEINEANIKVIIKKVTADLFKFLGESYFLTPETCLLHKRAPEFNRKTSQEILKGTKEPFHFMTKKIGKLKDLSQATTLDSTQEVSVLSFIEKNKRPPDFILTSNKVSVPLEGMMELLAALRILNDTYIFDDSEKKAYFIWQKDSSGQIVAAKVAKVKLSNFKPQKLHPDIIADENFSRLIKIKKDNKQNYLKSIRVAESRDLAIFWEALTENQKNRFTNTLREMKEKLTDKVLMEIFTRNGEFKRPEVKDEGFSSQINILLNATLRWIKLLSIVYANDKYEICHRKIEQVLSYEGIQFDDPYCTHDTDFKLVEKIENKPPVEGIYQLNQDSNSRWMAKQNQKNRLVDSSLSPTKSPKFQKNIDTIQEKIAFDLFSCLRDGFVIPETILSFQSQVVEDDQLCQLNPEINKKLYLMTKCVEDYQNLMQAKTKVAKNRLLKVVQYIRKYHCFPETLYYPPTRESVPILGTLEMLAAIKILGDREGCGKDGNHAGFQWIKDTSGKIIGAKAVKMNLGSAFEFADDFLAEKELVDKRPNEKSKDIQLAKNDPNLTIWWEKLQTEQQKQFRKAFKKMCQLLESPKILYDCIHRRQFRVSQKEPFPKKQATDVINLLQKWVKLQKKLYLKKDKKINTSKKTL